MLHPKPQNNQNGFSLVELLVVISIITVLGSIAMFQFTEFRARAYDAQALATLRNALSAQETYFIDYNQYQNCMNAGCDAPGLPGFQLGPELSIVTQPQGAGYVASASHSRGTLRYDYSSLTGKITTFP